MLRVTCLLYALTRVRCYATVVVHRLFRASILHHVHAMYIIRVAPAREPDFLALLLRQESSEIFNTAVSRSFQCFPPSPLMRGVSTHGI